MNTFTPIINCFSPFFIYLSLQVCKSFIMSVNGIDCEYRLLYRAKKHRKRIWKMFLKNTHRIMCWWTTRASESFDVWFRISTVVDDLKIEMGISAACRGKNWLAHLSVFFLFFFLSISLAPFFWLFPIKKSNQANDWCCPTRPSIRNSTQFKRVTAIYSHWERCSLYISRYSVWSGCRNKVSKVQIFIDFVGCVCLHAYPKNIH